MGEAEKPIDMPTIDAKDIEKMLYKQADLMRAYSKLCLKCEKGVLLPVDRVVNIGHNLSDTMARNLFGSYTVEDVEAMSVQKGVVHIWKCSNPGCDYEVK